MNKKSYRNVCGILLLDKPVGLSSNQALQRVKHLYQAKKAGHTGSLDVLAGGMLPICFGRATKFSQFLLNADKVYTVVAKLGEQTQTGDREGEIIEKKSTVHVTAALLQKVLQQFQGEIQQVPSMFSALKHQGRPLYQLARQGITVQREPRSVKIYALKQIKWQNDLLTLEVHCSKGTYVRTLVEDIGKALDCGAHAYSLRRLCVNDYVASQMLTSETLEKIQATEGLRGLDACLLPIDSMLMRLPVLSLTALQVRTLQVGRSLRLPDQTVGFTRLLEPSNHFLGVGEIQPDGVLSAKCLVHN